MPGQGDAVLLKDRIGCFQKIMDPADAKVGGGLVDHFLNGHRIKAFIQRGVEHMAEFAHTLASKQGREDAEHLLVPGQAAFFRYFLSGEICGDFHPFRIGFH